MAEVDNESYEESDYKDIQDDYDQLNSGKKAKDSELLQIPHETDTDDVAVDQTEDLMYNR
jgi:hypothetical protein